VSISAKGRRKGLLIFVVVLCCFLAFPGQANLTGIL
jgi:hypothetical protein